MKTRNFKIMSLLLGIIILFSALSGCGNKETNTITHATIIFNSNGGEEILNVIDVVPNEPIVSKEGYVFDGWFLDSDFSNPVTFPFYACEDTILHAKWATPIEKYIRSNGIYHYQAKIRIQGTMQTLGYFDFSYDKTSEKIIVSGHTVSPFYPTAGIEYSYPLSDISSGDGFFSSGNNKYPMKISKGTEKKVKINVTGDIQYFDSDFPYKFGTSIITVMNIKEFYYEINEAFSAYYSYCLDKFSLLVY